MMNFMIATYILTDCEIWRNQKELNQKRTHLDIYISLISTKKKQTTLLHIKFAVTILEEIEEKLDKEYKRKRDNQSPSEKREHYTKICRRCDEWKN